MSALLVVAIVTTGSAVIGAILVRRTRRLFALDARQRRRSRTHELHWAAIRLRSNGHRGAELQETLCALTNCTPLEADQAISQVGANI